MSLEEYFSDIEENSIKQRIRALRNKVVRTHRIIDLENIPFWESLINLDELEEALATTYKKEYSDGTEMLLDIILVGTTAVFGLYDKEEQIVYEYWTTY